MLNDQVTCRACQRDMVPSLWTYRPPFGHFRYLKVQHICPICGTVNYESGGRMTPGGIVRLNLVCVPLALFVCYVLYQYEYGLTLYDTIRAAVFSLGAGVLTLLCAGLYRGRHLAARLMRFIRRG